jgi:hypothetical protein
VHAVRYRSLAKLFGIAFDTGVFRRLIQGRVMAWLNFDASDKSPDMSANRWITGQHKRRKVG